MKIILTGGCGFIGSAVIRHVIRYTNHEILNIDKMTYAASEAALDFANDSPRHQLAKADITDAAAMRDLFETFQPDAVMHLAAESHVDRSIDGPGAFVQTNVVGTFTLLQAAREYFIKLAPEHQGKFRFHHISTDEVFGALGQPLLGQ
jgi:dTDP-glucose 4,6-dehydratase